MKKGGLFLLIIFSIMAFLPWSGALAQDANARLILSPSSGTYTVGSSFTVKVMVDSGGGDGINASEGVINYDSEYLSVSSVNKNGTIFVLWVDEPTFSNASGKINYSGGLTSAYTGTAGTIFNIVFTAKKAGTTGVNFTNGVVLAADGKGTNVFGGFGNASFTIEEKQAVEEKQPDRRRDETPVEEDVPKGILPPAPEISSITHPDEDVWYSNNDPELKWKLLSDIRGVSFSITDEEGDPGNVSDGIIESKVFDNVEDGIKYFNIKYQNQIGWGKVSSRKLMIDASAPVISSAFMENQGDATNPSPIFKYTATDTTSGIDKYYLYYNGNTVEYDSREHPDMAYRFEPLAPDEYNLEFVVKDMAGNVSSSTLRFDIEALKAPIISEIPKIISNRDELVVRGSTFYPNVTVKLYISQDDEDPTLLGNATTDEEGYFNYFHKDKLAKGMYEIWAQVVDDRGALSQISTKHVMQVVSPSVIVAYGWYIIAILLILIVLLVFIILYQRVKFKEEKERIMNETKEAKVRLSDIFAALREEVDELMEMADKKKGLSESERRVKEKLQEALNISQEFLEKEIEDVKKEIKMNDKDA